MAQQATITLDDVLDLKYLGKWDWSPTSGWIGWTWDAGGVIDLWLAQPGGAQGRRLTEAKEGVQDFAWRPGTDELAYADDSGLWLAAPDGAGWYAARRLVARKDKHGQLTWSPDGATLAYACAGALWLYEVATGEHREVGLPGKLTAGWQASAPVAWSADGRWLACGFVSEIGLPAVAVVGPDGRVAWRSAEEDPVGGQVWVDAGTLVFRVTRQLSTVTDTYLVLMQAGQEKPLVQRLHRTAGDGLGPDWPGPVVPSPDGSQVVMLLEDDGWAHLYLHDRAGGGLEQVTFGECEDFGHAGDEPAWTPDGSHVVYSSNRAGHGWRHLWALEAATGANHQLTHGEVTDVQPKVSPDGRFLAFGRADAFRNLDLWVAPWGDLGAARQITFSMPPAWTPEAQVRAEEVSYKGALGWDIQAQLYRPHGWGPGDGKRFPALVWVHGGPVRQMRPTWHPMHSYALFHAYHQYLLHQGYVVLAINFRGGIGYGRGFRHGLYHKMGVDDVTDVVEAGRYLKSLPYVDPERVAVWGLSYGGYMTLHCLTQHPEAFACGINVAGIWDFAQWTKWVEKRHGRTGGLFKAYLGGDPEQAPDLYRQASPCTFKEGLRRPLINFHGTDDANVDFAQMDRIVLDCVELGHEYEAYYYPKEAHTFRWRRTWQDAFPKIEREMARHLKP
jgi:dipeptidyl aminopeptidase/acylaminoacyl peptidase